MLTFETLRGSINITQNDTEEDVCSKNDRLSASSTTWNHTKNDENEFENKIGQQEKFHRLKVFI